MGTEEEQGGGCVMAHWGTKPEWRPWRGQKCVCPRSVESRADRFADGLGVGSEIKERNQG